MALPSAAVIVGRDTERGTLRALLDSALQGRSGALVVHGAAGSGKTALIDDLIAGADGVRVLRAVGLEREAHLPHAALGELLSPLIDLREELPGAQARAIGAAL